MICNSGFFRALRVIAFVLTIFFYGSVARGQYISTVAGNGTAGYLGDGGPATNAELDLYVPPVAIGFFGNSVGFDYSGNMFVADNGNNAVRKVSPSGMISTIAGIVTGYGYNGDNIPATTAELNNPVAVAADPIGNVYVADLNNGRIRKVSIEGIITTVAGTGGCAAASGDGGQATAACIGSPCALAFDKSGDLYFADWDNSLVRKISTTGIISTVAGNGTNGYNGDMQPATAATLWHPAGIAFDTAQNLYIADMDNNRIRKVDIHDTIHTIAGNGGVSYIADSVSATATAVSGPVGIAVDAAGNLYVGESDYRVRKIDTSGMITTCVGTGTSGYNGENVAATSALLGYVGGVAANSRGDLFVSDMSNNRVRRITTGTLSVTNINAGVTNVSVYPNPSPGHFVLQVSSPDTYPFNVTMVNELGEKVAVAAGVTNRAQEINVDVPPGLYYLLVQSAGNNYTQKVLVQ